MQLEALREFRAQLERERERKNRWKDRELDRSKARAVYNKLPKSPKGKLERLSEEEWKDIDTKQKKRGLSWFGDSGSGVSAYSNSILADPSEYYDKWAQAYRMLGGFIDCDHAKSGDSHDNNNNNNNNNNNDGACSRWMLWAAVRLLSNLFMDSQSDLSISLFSPCSMSTQTIKEMHTTSILVKIRLVLWIVTIRNLLGNCWAFIGKNSINT
jgi:hypothetical protein